MRRVLSGSNISKQILIQHCRYCVTSLITLTLRIVTVTGDEADLIIQMKDLLSIHTA